MKTLPEKNPTAARRAAAEAQLKKQNAGRRPQSEADTRRLQHELEVHQIELEMQNDELRAAQKEISTGLERFTELFDLAPAGYFNLTADGTIRLVNLTGAKLLGIDRAHLSGQRFHRLVAEGERKIFSDFLDRVFASSKNENCRVLLTPAGQSPLIVRLDAKRTAEGACCRVVMTDITAQRQAEQALILSERRFRRLFESMMDAFVAVNLAGQIQESNPTYRKMLGHSDEELKRLTYQDLTPEKWHAFEADIIQRQVLPLGSSGVYEKEYRRKDGSVFPVEMRTHLIKDDQGKPVKMWAIVRDITERKRLERKLTNKTTYLQAIIEAEPECVKIVSPTGALLDMNPAGLRMIECQSLAQAQSKPLIEFVAPEHHAAFQNLHRQVMQGQSAELQFEMIGFNGTRRWMEAHAVPLPDPDGGRPNLLAVTQDITSRKLAEQATRKSQSLLQSVTEGKTDAVYVKDLQGRYLMFNATASRIVGKPVEEVLGKDDTALFPEEQARKVMDGDRHVMESDATKTYEELVDTVTGRTIFLATKGPMHDEHGRVIGLFGIARDITERKRIETALLQSNELNKSLLKTMPLGMEIVDAEGNILFQNAALVQAVGKPTLGKKCWEVYRDDQQQCDHCPLKQPVNMGETKSIETSGVLGGRIFEIKHTGMVFQGKPAIMEVFNDITVRKQAEAAMRKQAETLAARNDELNRFNRVAVNRELRMIELKREINELCQKLGEPPRHHLAEPPPAAEATRKGTA